MELLYIVAREPCPEAESMRSCDVHRGKPDISGYSHGKFRPLYAKYIFTVFQKSLKI